MNTLRFLVISSMAMACLIFIPDRAQATQITDVTARCEALESADFSHIPDAVTQVINAKFVDASAGPSASTYCEASGYVAPNVGFLLRLPTERWNGKFIELGCGGACGSLDHITRCDDPLRRGYACVVSDGGHRSSGIDVKWAYHNPQAQMDYVVLASHVTALAGKVLAQRYYGRAPNKSYFMGCSAGGIQAMWLAQRFPWDFDGIAAGSPCPHLSASWMNLLWGNRALMDSKGEPLLREDDLELLHRAVVAKCDMNDGVRDGLIGDPRTCHFDPEELRCVAGQQGRCLTREQIQAIEKIYSGPVTSRGMQIVPPAAEKGSELTWPVWFGGSASHASAWYNYIAEWFRYYFFQPSPGPTWNVGDFDFDRDYKRLGMAEISEWGNSPDLHRFKAAGGRLLAYTGWNDAVVGVRDTVSYYEDVERIMGGRKGTQGFFRLFLIPGINHCGVSDKADRMAYLVDWLSYLEAWVEEGQAPDKIIGGYLKADAGTSPVRFPLDPATVDFSRPVYPYPLIAKYTDHGDPHDASSFVSVKPR